MLRKTAVRLVRPTPDFIRSVVTEILTLNYWNEDGLAKDVGVTQPTISQWRNMQSFPRPMHLKRLLGIHAEAKCRHWDSTGFVPICAFAKSYPDSLREEAKSILQATLNSAPLIASPRLCGKALCADIHIRSAKLPDDVSAYSFANACNEPTIFVVLVEKGKDVTEQRRLAWEEMYAHVMKFDDRTAATLPFSPSIIKHYRA